MHRNGITARGAAVVVYLSSVIMGTGVYIAGAA